MRQSQIVQSVMLAAGPFREWRVTGDEWRVNNKSGNHKNYNFLGFDWFKKGLFSTNSLAKLLSDSLLLDSLLLDSLLSDSSKSQSYSKM